MKRIVIHINAPDQSGIVSHYTEVLASMNINIINLEQHVEPDDHLFFMRIEGEVEENKFNLSNLKKNLSNKDSDFCAESCVYDLSKKLNLAILVTKESLPLYDILIKNQTKELNTNIKMVISNHGTLGSIAEQFNVEYRKINTNQNKDEGNRLLRSMLVDNKIDLVVLARYMQIIPKDIIDIFKRKIINIHHGFLPAFKGDNAYRKAWVRGVKIIGATAHYVTEQLDEGPIIAQDVETVSHHHSISEMMDSGRNLERNVLVSAIKAHTEYRVMNHGKRTIIFNR